MAALRPATFVQPEGKGKALLPPIKIPLPPTAGRCAPPSELNLTDVPDLSPTCLNCMPKQLGVYFRSVAGKTMWKKMYALVKFHTSERGEFMLVEDFVGLFSHHFSLQIQWQRDFKEHQNVVFACIQDWFDTWFDRLTDMRVRVRSTPRPQSAMKPHDRLAVKPDKTSLDDSDSSEDDMSVEKDDKEIKMPAIESCFADWKSEYTIDVVRHARWKFFRLLLLYFRPLEGLSLKQLPKALPYCGFVQMTINEANIRKYMSDIVEIRQKGTIKFVRVKLDAKGLDISESVLKARGIFNTYNAAQNKCVPPKPPAPVAAPQVSEAPKPVAPPVSETKPMPLEVGPRLSGVCLYFNNEEGHGFIKLAGHEIFVSAENLVSDTQSLQKDQEVEFQIRMTETGPEAINVTGTAGTELHEQETVTQPARVEFPTIRASGFRARASSRALRSRAPATFAHRHTAPSPSCYNQGSGVLDGFGAALAQELPRQSQSAVGSMPVVLRDFCVMLARQPGFQIDWTQLKDIPGYEARETRLAVQSYVLESNTFESIVSAEMTRDDSVVVKLHHPYLFMSN